MLEVLKPDYCLSHYTQINQEWLKDKRVKFILSDLDSTLLRHNEKLTEECKKWYKELEQEEVGLIIVSNNKKKRVKPVVDELSIVGYENCKKPSVKKIEEELFYKGLNPETTIFLGDQLFTDIWCAKRLGIRSVLVDPIPSREPMQIKIKRKIEKFVTKTWGE